MDWTTVIAIIGALSGLSGLVGVVLFYKPTKRKIVAEAVHLEAAAKHEAADVVEHTLDGAFKLIERLQSSQTATEQKMKDLQCENDNFKKRLEKALRRIENLMQGIRILFNQLKANRIEPAWEPDEWNDEP